MGDVLSQDEIDSLLSALNSGEINPDEIDDTPKVAVKDYDFARPSKFSKDHCVLWRSFLKIMADFFRQICRHICVNQYRLK